MSIEITKTMRYEIEYKKELYNLLSDIQYAVWRIKNKSVNMAWDWQQFSFGYNERFGEYPSQSKVLGKTMVNDIIGNTKELGYFMSSGIYSESSREIVMAFERDKIGIAKGRAIIPNPNSDKSFPIRAKQIKELERVNKKKYNAKLSLLSRKGAKERGVKTQVPVVLRTGPGASDILDRIIEGEYKLCDSRIGKVKNKFYLLVTYKFEKEVEERDKTRIMGVDLGIANFAYTAFSFDNWLRYNIEGNEILEFKRRVEARRKSMQRQSKYAGKGRRGRGRKTLLKPIEKLRGKVNNFKRTTNHKYSKYIVDLADKHNCGVIQMEDLSGIKNNDWTYYEFQNYVEYKAKERGIEVRKVNPLYTSQRCSCCGYIAKNNRPNSKDKRIPQNKFECVICGYKTHADFNAAKNISNPRIEKLIKDELERQEQERKLAT